MTLDELSQIASKNGLELSQGQLSLLGAYASLLIEKNKVVNLISRKDEDHILDRHILHSLTLAMPSVIGYTLPLDAKIFDIGTGGGLPAIPLAIVRPDLRIVACDSIAKKISAVKEFIQALALKNITGLTSRAEDLAKQSDHRRAYDAIVSRAVAPLDELVRWTTMLMKPGAVLLSLKGGDLTGEVSRTRSLKHVLEVTELSLTLNDYQDFARDEKKVVRVLLR